MKGVVALAAVVALIGAPAAAAPPKLYRFETTHRLYLGFETPVARDLDDAIALALDRHAFALAYPRGPRYTLQPLEPRYTTPVRIAEARELAQPWAGTVLRIGSASSFLPALDVLRYDLNQIGLDLAVHPLRGPPTFNPPPDDLGLWAFLPDYPGEPVELALGVDRLAPVGKFVDHVFVSGRVGCMTYSRVYGVDLAALCVR